MTVPATLDYSALSFPVKVNIIPADQVFNRPGIEMDPWTFTWHETGNPNPGMDAERHMIWLHNGAPGAASKYVCVHFFIDENEAWQTLPLNEVGWHAGDSSGNGNFHSLSFEFCIHSDGDFWKTWENLCELMAFLAFRLQLDPHEVYQHNFWSGKHCPTLLRNMGANAWASTLARILFYHQKFLGLPKPIQYAPVVLPRFWSEQALESGKDQMVGNVKLYYFRREMTAARGTPVRAQASMKAPKVRANLKVGEKVQVRYLSKGPTGIRWAWTKYGSRIRLDALLPRINFAAMVAGNDEEVILDV